MQPLLLYVRKRDHGVFVPCTEPTLMNPPLMFRVKYIARRWWQRRGQFARTGEAWSPKYHSEYDVVNRAVIESGFKELCKRSGKRELQ